MKTIAGRSLAGLCIGAALVSAVAIIVAAKDCCYEIRMINCAEDEGEDTFTCAEKCALRTPSGNCGEGSDEYLVPREFPVEKGGFKNLDTSGLPVLCNVEYYCQITDTPCNRPGLTTYVCESTDEVANYSIHANIEGKDPCPE